MSSSEPSIPSEARGDFDDVYADVGTDYYGCDTISLLFIKIPSLKDVCVSNFRLV